MPFTQAYTKQLNELSIKIKQALDLLFNESLVAFAEKTGVALNNNSRFQSLLDTPISDLNAHQQNTLRGENKNEYNSRQQLLALRQAWNEVLRLHQLILNKVLITQKILDEEINTFTTIFQKATAKLIEEIFPGSELTEEKIHFVAGFMTLAHQLLKKQCAVQALLATNATHTIEQYHENPTLQKAEAAYNEAVATHNQKWAANVKLHEGALNTLEKKEHDINGVRLALLDKKDELLVTNNTMTEHTTNLASVEKTLKDLIETTVQDNATIASLTAFDTELESAATSLLDNIKAYKTNVIECTTSTAEKTNAFIDPKNTALDTLAQEANNACPAQPLAEDSLKVSLATLEPFHLALCKEIDAEILQLEARLAALTALNAQRNADSRRAEQALAVHLPTLANTDETALTAFKEACVAQHGLLTIGSTPWTRLSDFAKAQFEAINTLNETNQGMSQSQAPESVLDASAAQTITQAQTDTNTRLTQLRQQRANITHQHNNRKQQGAAHLNNGTETVKAKIETLLTECASITDELITFNDEPAANGRLLALNQARETLRRVNQKRRDLLDQMDKLQRKQNEVDYLKQRVALLKEKIEGESFVIKADLHPDALLAELDALPINLALTKPKSTLVKFNLLTPLESLAHKVDQLDNGITKANKSYDYRRKGTIIGGAAVGGTLSLLLLSGLIASIVLSFGLSLPITIAVGVAIAVSPGLFAGIGRFFGWRKDKAVNKQKTHQNKQESQNQKSAIETGERSRNILTRAQSMRSQLSIVEATEDDIERYLQHAQNPQTKRPLERRSTIRKSLYRLDRHSIPDSVGSTFHLNAALQQTRDAEDVVQSFDPDLEEKTTPLRDGRSVHFAEDPTSSSEEEAHPSFEAVPKTTPRTATPPIEADDASESEAEPELEDAPEEPAPYSMYTGGTFFGGLFSVSYTAAQPAQGKTSEPVAANTNGM